MSTTVIGSGKKVAENGNGKSAATAAVKNAEKPIEVQPKPEVTVADVRKSIEEQIEKFQRKSELISQRERFQQTKNELIDSLKKLGADHDENLESLNLKIVLVEKDARYTDGISISNNALVFEFIRMLLTKVIEKIQKLEAEIIS